MSGHTPGEWAVDTRHLARVVIPGRAGFNGLPYRVADAYFSSAGLANTPRGDEAKANARLIAASPDGLKLAHAVLEMLVANADVGAGLSPTERHVMEMAEALIAKASSP